MSKFPSQEEQMRDFKGMVPMLERYPSLDALLEHYKPCPLVITDSGKHKEFNRAIDNSELTIYGKITFNQPIKTNHCKISKALCSNSPRKTSYNTDEELHISENLIFLMGFHCDDVQYI